MLIDGAYLPASLDDLLAEPLDLVREDLFHDALSVHEEHGGNEGRRHDNEVIGEQMGDLVAEGVDDLPLLRGLLLDLAQVSVLQLEGDLLKLGVERK